MVLKKNFGGTTPFIPDKMIPMSYCSVTTFFKKIMHNIAHTRVFFGSFFFFFFFVYTFILDFELIFMGGKS